MTLLFISPAPVRPDSYRDVRQRGSLEGEEETYLLTITS